MYKNITREKFRSSSGRSPVYKPNDNRQGRVLNSHFNINTSEFQPIVEPHRRKYRHVNHDEDFYVSVMPQIFFEDSIAADSETHDEFIPLRRKFMPSKIHKPYRRNYTNLLRMNAAFRYPKPFRPSTEVVTEAVTEAQVTEGQFTEETTTEEQVTVGQVTEIFSEMVTDEMQEVVHVTPRSRMGKNRVIPMPSINDTRMDRQFKRIRPQAVAETGLKYFIANQHDVQNLITITNDGTLMTVGSLDREERDVYHLTVIGEYKQGATSGAGIYQVIIHVDDVNDNAPKFNLHSYSGTIMENSPVGTEVSLDQQILVTDADVGENAEFTITVNGEGSHLFIVESTNNTQEIRSRKPAESNHRMARAAPPRKSIRRRPSNNTQYITSSEIKKPQYILRFIGPNIIDRELENHYEIYLQAQDKGGLSSEVKMTIYVGDVNDNAPMFEKIAVFKDTGLEILEYTNDLEIYFIERQAPDALTYPIRHHLMDPERLLPSATNYEIMQFAESSNIGTPRQFGAHNENDTIVKPRYRRKNSESSYPLFSIPENIEVGSNILKLTAVDEDYEENAQIAYGIVSETFLSPKSSPKRINASKYFAIDQITGELRVQRTLPSQSEILLNVSAIDTGGLMDFTIVKFKVWKIGFWFNL